MGLLIRFTLKRGAKDRDPVLVAPSAIRAIAQAPADGGGAATLIYIGEAHPIRVCESVKEVLVLLGWDPIIIGEMLT